MGGVKGSGGRASLCCFAELRTAQTRLYTDAEEGLECEAPAAAAAFLPLVNVNAASAPALPLLLLPPLCITLLIHFLFS